MCSERQLAIEVHSDGLGLPTGLPLSGTALAASLLRDGWSVRISCFHSGDVSVFVGSCSHIESS